MKTFVKVTLGVIVGGLLLVVGCSALIAEGLDEQQGENAIANGEYDSIRRGQSRETLEARFGEPESADQFRDKLGSTRIDSDCAYWNLAEEDVGSFAQVCFQDGRVRSKSRHVF